MLLHDTFVLRLTRPESLLTGYRHTKFMYTCRGYYTVARRYEFYFRVAKQYFTNECIRRVMFFLLYRQKDIDKSRVIYRYNSHYFIITEI